MKECIFCKIVRGEIPSHKVFEDDKVLAFLSIVPVEKGHTILVHKFHNEDIFDMPHSVVKDVFLRVPRIAKKIKDSLDADGINIGMNNGVAAGQEVLHAHVHIIPRHKGNRSIKWDHTSYADGEMQKLAERINAVKED